MITVLFSKKISSSRIIKQYLMLCLLLTTLYNIQAQDIVINEVCSSNSTVLMDCDGDYSDWLELYNLSESDINLKNFTLSDDIEELNKWEFPNITIPANAYLVVFASDKDKFQDNEVHTSFKISQSGEALFLCNTNGAIISETDEIYIPTDYSYARIPTNQNAWIVTETPTPNAINIVGDGVVCSHASGFYTNSFDLELLATDKNMQIFYTLNGNTPTANSQLYTTPLPITDVSQTPYSYSGIPTTPLEGQYPLSLLIWKEPDAVYKCNTIRYAAFENGVRKGKVYSNSYFVDPEIHDKFEFSVASLIIDSLSLFDYDTGIYIPGRRFDENGFDWFPDGNYHNRGNEWERNVFVSYFEHDGSLAFETDAGIRMRGYGSASFPQKSLNMYFRSEYGLNKINYPLFENAKTNTYKRLIFRNGGNDFLSAHIRDAMLQEVMSPMDLEKQDFSPVVLFINGEYWGIHNLREKYDKYYFKYKYGLDEDEINILGICGAIEEGDNADYVEVLNFASNNDLSVKENYSFVDDRIDINNFIDFQIAEIYFANYDWPCNNFKIWRDNTPGSKWRFLIYDLDYSFGYAESTCLYTTESMEHATNDANEWPWCSCSNIMFRQLLLNEDFKEQFVTRFAFHLNNTFIIERVVNIIDDFENTFNDEMKEHIKRWHYPASYGEWLYEVDQLRYFAENRPAFMINNLVEYFDLDEFELNYLDAVDDIVLYPNPNPGHFALYNNTMTDITNGKITMINSFGQVIFTRSNIDISRKLSYHVYPDNLKAGMYIFIFENNSNVLTKKVIVSGTN